MTDPAREPASGDRPAAGPGRSSSDVPRWVKLFGLVAIIVALLLLVLMLVAGGEHGPARHMSWGAGVGPAAVVAGSTAGSLNP